MYYKLFLDDVRSPEDVRWVLLPDGPWTIARNYNEFVKHIETLGLPAFVAFDHDLADEHYGSVIAKSTYKEKTGFECAKWLVEYCMARNLKFPKYTVHSMNPVGRDNIKNYIESFKSSCQQ